MDVLLLGSTGRVGKCVMDVVLSKGHRVTVLVRDKNKINLNHNDLKVIEGDVYDWSLLKDLSKLHFDAIINLIGGNPLKPSTAVADAAISVASFFTEKTYLYIAATTVAQMKKTFFGHLSVAALELSNLKHAIADHQKAFEIIKASELNWRLVGCPAIKNGLARGNFKNAGVFPGGFKTIYPGDVALVIANQLETNINKGITGVWY